MNAYDHIILISLDTLRSDCVGIHPLPQWPRKYPGLTKPDTAVLDAIAGSGAYFYNCISAAPYTSASHASIFTGQWPLRHGVYEFFNQPLRSPTLFSAGKAAGYRTFFKTDFPIILGRFLGFDREIDEYIVEDDDRFLASLRATKRSVSLAHFGGVHVPYGFHDLKSGGDDYRDKVAQLERELPAQLEPLADSLVETYRDQEDTDLLLRYKRVVQWHYTSGNYARLFELYLEGIEYFLEHRFRLFFERLASALEGTRHLVVLFGDHGEEYDQETYGHFNSASDGVLQIPAIFWGTDVKPSMHGPRIRSIDIAPTILRMAELKPQTDMQGVSLADTVLSGAAYPERVAIAQSYTSEVREFVAHQKKMLETGQHPGPLRHVLYKEAVYDDAFRLLRKHHSYAMHGAAYQPMAPETALQRRIADGAWIGTQNVDAENHLAVLLDDYNRGRSATEAAARDRPEGVLQHLRNMGYEV